jgi:uncharacterized membrane protein YdjX (TVP38/TMEM64 family)
MSESFVNLIHAPEPVLLIALHLVKATLLLVPVFLILLLVSLFFGFEAKIWVYLLFASIAGSIVSSLIANKWSELRFVRRAKTHGLDPTEAREFYRTYDWDGADAQD